MYKRQLQVSQPASYPANEGARQPAIKQASQQASKPTSQQHASKQASKQANKQRSMQASKPAIKQTGKQATRRASPQTELSRTHYAKHVQYNHLVSISNPYSSGTVRRSSTRPCIETGSCIAAQRRCTECLVAKYGSEWSSSRRARNGRMLATWPMRLAALTKCTVRPLNFRCGLFHPSPS